MGRDSGKSVLETIYLEHAQTLVDAGLGHQLPRVKTQDYDQRLGSEKKVDAAVAAGKVLKCGVHVFLPGREAWSADNWLTGVGRCSDWPKCPQGRCECAEERAGIVEDSA